MAAAIPHQSRNYRQPCGCCILFVLLLLAWAATATAEVTSLNSADVADAARLEQHQQLAVICTTTPKESFKSAYKPCSQSRYSWLISKYEPMLWDSTRWPAVSASASTPAAADATFVILTRELQPAEASVQFAAAFCATLGARLAFWDNLQEYSTLAALARTAGQQLGGPLYAYVGAVQLPGSQEPRGGWVWLHKRYSVSARFPWGPSEPSEGRSSKVRGRRKQDCAVLATSYSSTSMVADFPCSLPAGQPAGSRPKLTVACRLV